MQSSSLTFCWWQLHPIFALTSTSDFLSCFFFYNFIWLGKVLIRYYSTDMYHIFILVIILSVFDCFRKTIIYILKWFWKLIDMGFLFVIEIELPKALEDKVYRLFLDPTGKHLIICMESTENLYLSRNSRKPRSIGKLKVSQ